MARKSEYSEEKANQIIEYLIEGKTLTAACKSLSIGVSTVYHWMVEHDDFADQYDRARRFGDYLLEDMAIDEITQPRIIEEKATYDDGRTVIKTVDNVARSRAIADTYMKIIARRRGSGNFSQTEIKEKEKEKAMFKNMFANMA